MFSSNVFPLNNSQRLFYKIFLSSIRSSWKRSSTKSSCKTEKPWIGRKSVIVLAERIFERESYVDGVRARWTATDRKSLQSERVVSCRNRKDSSYTHHAMGDSRWWQFCVWYMFVSMTDEERVFSLCRYRHNDLSLVECETKRTKIKGNFIST